MKIQASVETCITKQYADFIGTATRSEFWWFILFLVVVQALLGIASHVIAAIFALATLVPYFAVGTRRLRDTGRSPWWWLIGLIPLVGAI
ncbi:MAG: DUF805 domain-containing protein, partial [Pseudomonadota bacterium]|nr:DUF805 domain-containing protein [Pseudomonadota bacterium]